MQRGRIRAPDIRRSIASSFIPSRNTNSFFNPSVNNPGTQFLYLFPRHLWSPFFEYFYFEIHAELFDIKAIVRLELNLPIRL